MKYTFGYKYIKTLSIIVILVCLCACGTKENKNTKPVINNDTNMKEEVLENNGFIFDDIKPYDDKKVRIAFIGDSITYGYLADDPKSESYPAQLAILMENKYNIGNFGKNAAYVLDADDKFNVKEKDRSYKNTEEYINSLAFNPDVVVFMLGINDVRSIAESSEAQDDFVETYIRLIEEYLDLESVKKVYVATAIRNHHSSALIKYWGDGLIQDLQKKAAERLNLEVIDIYNMTKEDFESLSYYNEDGLHLNAKGYGKIAEAFYKFFKK